MVLHFEGVASGGPGQVVRDLEPLFVRTDTRQVVGPGAERLASHREAQKAKASNIFNDLIGPPGFVAPDCQRWVANPFLLRTPNPGKGRFHDLSGAGVGVREHMAVDRKLALALIPVRPY